MKFTFSFMKRSFLIIIFTMLATAVFAQGVETSAKSGEVQQPVAQKTSKVKPDSEILSRWSIGIATGYHPNLMRFRGISKEAYPEREANHSGLFLLFAEYRAPKNFSFRPEIGFLSRGGTLYMRNLGQVVQGTYSLKAKYFDIRVPIIYNIPLKKTKIQPYAYIAPVLGFTLGGNVSLSELTRNGDLHRYNLKLSKGNMASAYFGMAIGAGVKYPIKIVGHTFHIGAEFSYELGFTDTYSKRERNSDVTIVNNMPGPVASTRKNSGFELKVSFSVPLTIFKKRPKVVKPEPVYVPQPAPAPAPVVKKEEKPCYTLQEIQQMVAEGKDVNGKTICSVDDIHFDISQCTIKENSKKYLEQVVSVICDTGLYVEVKGHTDSSGSEEFNMKLSKDRALAVYNYLISNGVSKDKVAYSYYGESEPLTSNETPEGRKLNRRVEFVLIKK